MTMALPNRVLYLEDDAMDAGLACRALAAQAPQQPGANSCIVEPVDFSKFLEVASPSRAVLVRIERAAAMMRICR